MDVKTSLKPKKQLRTLVQLHSDEKNGFKVKQKLILDLIGAKGVSSYYDIINGNRKVRSVEKAPIAAIFGLEVDEIDWQDEKILPEAGTKA